MNTFLSTLIVLAAVAQSSDVAVKPSSSNVIVQRSITVAQPPQQIRGTGISTSRSDYALNERPLSDQARAGVLVIPTPELTAESLAELTEDLTVMCRIFGKAVAPNRAGVGGYQPFRYVVDTQCVQGLYLDGYGALFFLDVDYPLLPEEQKEPVQSKPQEPGDPVWSQTIDEMTGRQSDEGRGGRAGPTYDAQRVENLKKTLVKTLAHAANIRTRRPQDIITLVVGSFDDTQTPYRTGTASPLRSDRRRAFKQPHSGPDRAARRRAAGHARRQVRRGRLLERPTDPATVHGEGPDPVVVAHVECLEGGETPSHTGSILRGQYSLAARPTQ